MNRLLLLFALVLVPAIAFADEEESSNDVSVNTQGAALHGKGWPQLIVETHGSVLGLTAKLKRSDGTSVNLSSGRLGSGARKLFDLHQPDGAFHYEGSLVAKFPHGEPQSLPVAFDTAVFPPPKLSFGESPVDLKANTVTLKIDRPSPTIHMVIHSDDGGTADDQTVPFPDAKPGDPLTVTWKESDPAVVLQIEIRVTDKYGFFQDISFYPWKVEIPHEDVLFDSGKWDILPTEAPKLDSALGELAKAIEKYGRFAKVQLFVAGYTDTVGDAMSNKTLSESRATSIGRYFRSHGVRIPISCAGMGEDGLLVPTPDETPEPKNRRAAYIVSIEPPRGTRWTPLK